jgi:hypothetical protein
MTRRTSRDDLDRFRGARSLLTGPPVLTLQGYLPGEFLRINKVEGVFTGASVLLRLRDAAPGLALHATGGYAWHEETFRGRAGCGLAERLLDPRGRRGPGAECHQQVPGPVRQSGARRPGRARQLGLSRAARGRSPHNPATRRIGKHRPGGRRRGRRPGAHPSHDALPGRLAASGQSRDCTRDTISELGRCWTGTPRSARSSSGAALDFGSRRSTPGEIWTTPGSKRGW